MSIVRAEAIYDGGTVELIKDTQTGLYIADAKALKKDIRTDKKVSYYPIILRVTDDAGNVTTKTVSDAAIGENLLLTVREEDLFPMRFIVADANRIELGYVDVPTKIDLDLGDTNDFELELPAVSEKFKNYDFGHMIYIPGTEYGGLIEDRKTSTKQNTITYMGYTWRGLLNLKIIEPPSGQSHLSVNGEANKVIQSILGNRFGSLFVSDDIDSGITVNYQFDRYTTLLGGLTKMLESNRARLKIYYKQGEGIEAGAVHVCAAPITDWSGELEYSQDNRMHFATRDYRRGINHLICAGEGEGVDRAVLHLYVNEKGDITEKQYYTGIDERAALYSYTSQEDMDKLREDGNKRLNGLKNYTQFELSLVNMDVDIGDMIGGRDRLTGLVLRQPVVGKILKIEDGRCKIDYKIKGDE